MLVTVRYTVVECGISKYRSKYRVNGKIVAINLKWFTFHWIMGNMCRFFFFMNSFILRITVNVREIKRLKKKQHSKERRKKNESTHT